MAMTEYQRWALAFLAIIAVELGVLIILKFVRRSPDRRTRSYDDGPESILDHVEPKRPAGGIANETHAQWIERLKDSL